VLGELGWWTLKARRWLLRLRYWGKLVKLGRDRLTRVVYNESRRRYVEEGAKNWASYTHRIMCVLGLQDFWDKDNTDITTKAWNDEVEAAVLKWEQRNWLEGLASKTKLENYRNWKRTWGLEKYLLIGGELEGTRTLTRLRSGANSLEIDQGRQKGVVRENRICRVCGNGVEDEVHFVLNCIRYVKGRERMMQKLRILMPVTRNWQMNGDIDKLMTFLMGGDHREGYDKALKEVKQFLAWAMHIRRKTLKTIVGGMMSTERT
jgi:hypothetical protein